MLGKRVEKEKEIEGRKSREKRNKRKGEGWMGREGESEIQSSTGLMERELCSGQGLKHKSCCEACFPATSKSSKMQSSTKDQGCRHSPLEPWPALLAAPKTRASSEAGMAGRGGRRRMEEAQRRRKEKTRHVWAGKRPAPRQVANAENPGSSLGCARSSSYFFEESPFLHSQTMSKWIKKNRMFFMKFLSV
ncbi:unnamed protein product [Nyctereutes procyonoides]|uniref:(raccoon dog) hypothetical protein n=1 Tax=Nyctereutes procyonoides TaxID=34880 RepID=A0A811Z186_NYCPR|nr:unnamed protein product [Nyctereutes procyonoides]